MQRSGGGSKASARQHRALKGPDAAVDVLLVWNAANQGENPSGIPSKGDRIELRGTEKAAHLRGTVFYADQLQILVKWDNGRSQCLRVGIDRYRIVE